MLVVHLLLNAHYLIIALEATASCQVNTGCWTCPNHLLCGDGTLYAEAAALIAMHGTVERQKAAAMAVQHN